MRDLLRRQEVHAAASGGALHQVPVEGPGATQRVPRLRVRQAVRGARAHGEVHEGQ